MRWRLPVVAALLAALPLAHATTPAVVLVQPSADSVPANLLRLSIVFAAPVEGPVLRRIALAHADGRAVADPFLPQELWSPDGTILTLLLHPGRVKTGLAAREQWGPVLHEGDEVVLTLDGRPIRRWHVGAEDADGPMTSAWKLSSPRPGSRQPLVVALDAPVDGRDAEDFAVVDDHRRIDGHGQLQRGETAWTFTPDAAWVAGRYRLLVRGTLEDPAGNRLGGHFETPPGTTQPPPVDASLGFEVGGGPVDSSSR